jgi:hypothetical protein
MSAARRPSDSKPNAVMGTHSRDATGFEGRESANVRKVTGK